MGRHDVHRNASAETVRAFTTAVIRDLGALEAMLDRGLLETGVRRIGAEQEMFIADAGWSPAPLALELIEDLGDPGYTTEIARFNLEYNMPPLDVTGDVLTRFHDRLMAAVEAADRAARARGAHIVLTGILPTLTQSRLSLDNVTPAERYFALNEAVMAQAGGRLRLLLQGMDELRMEHDSVMLESCNTSFQLHLQVDPREFAATYNVAQAICGPVLASAVNSPLLFGRRLWHETRIGLFGQAVDVRRSGSFPRETLPRVWFGDSWVRESVAEVFRENIMRHRPLIAAEGAEDPFEALADGRPPRLDALQLHNGTIYRWNRPCYGISNGRPHLRIEFRALPSGPSVADEIANAAFWIGLVVGGASAFADVHERMELSDARANFVAAARHGLDTTFTWLDGERIGAAELIRERLLPLALEGLVSLGTDRQDAERRLGIIDRRTATGMSGARWLLKSDAALRDACPRSERLATLTSLAARAAATGRPVHEWPVADPADLQFVNSRYDRVEDCMTTDLLTAREDDAVDLVAFIMDQRGVRQLVVEDEAGRPVGVISWRSILHLFAGGELRDIDRSVPVRDVMVRDFLTVCPDTPTAEAIRVMRENGVTALPVLQDGQLVGIVSEHDFLPVVTSLLRAGDSFDRIDVTGP